MADDTRSTSNLLKKAAPYRITVSGRLTAEWSPRLQGMRAVPIHLQRHGNATELTGVLPDQAALMGVLTFLYDRGFALISVKVDNVAHRDS